MSGTRRRPAIMAVGALGYIRLMDWGVAGAQIFARRPAHG
jgi:hypothetical protein